ncbi:Cytidine monophosphate-N-acetylneuraminic acid hydroxylase [Triplophysa tibetana]|uniref:Cytidine monophosphate-N-acetylneuraminic acid hydroxylase n=1 Tax=Triplophysa tibetana TaxID=1572043 RepID=A0A5A9PFL4_9TELE|nr:Cytidine monophosphate-N-acetylneuraminic acid hydroxylase [Triplophysa tibetana]
MTPQVSRTVLRLEASEVRELKYGINFKKNPEDGKCYIVFKDKDKARACKNQCKHQGGLFIKDIEDLDGRTVRCTKHFWKLDVSTMEYVNPPDSFLQDELEVVVSDTDGSMELVELNPPDPWTLDPREAQDLQPGELTLPHFEITRREAARYSHLCWRHLAAGVLVPGEKRCELNKHHCCAFRRMAECMLFARLSRLTIVHIDVEKGYTNSFSYSVISKVDEHLRFMILMDGVHPEMDTCLIVEYKGHMILNTVDCTRPNNGRLPQGVDVMMSDFAGGASGFPMTFHGGKYTESWKADFIKNERKKLLNYKTQLVKSLQPKIYCPFAGYFTEAHPSDRYIKETNIKNSAEDLNASIRKACPNTLTWTPSPCSVLDVAQALADQSNREAITQPPNTTKIYKDSWDFDLYLEELNAAISNDIFEHKSWIQFYYNWAGFKGYNLVIKVIETDDDFKPLDGGYDYLVDFMDLSFPDKRPERDHPYEEVIDKITEI